jgi:hypothetical protein
LGIDGLNYDDLSPVLLFHGDLLILVAVERARGVCLLTQRLDRRHHRCLIRLERLSQRSVVINIYRHRVQHRRKGHQRDEGRIEPLPLRGVGERLSLQVGVLLHPVVRIENLLGVGRRRTYLRKERVRIQRDRSQQLI